MKAFKLFDTSQGKMDLEENINDWLGQNGGIDIIAAHLMWDGSNLVYTILYAKGNNTDSVLTEQENVAISLV
ncbi:MAG: hypothetical protein WC756_19310 [Taibaiella sp.]|jgi:hypothetical protein